MEIFQNPHFISEEHTIAIAAMVNLLAGLILLTGLLAPPLWAQSLEDGIQAYRSGDYPEALHILTPLSMAGNIEAQSVLGVMYYNGHGVNEDDSRAYELFMNAAEKGNSDAQYNLASMYLYNPSLPTDIVNRDEEAARWYFSAAQQGHAEAQYHLGLLLMAGTGVRQNPEEAFSWISKAAEQGHEEARAFTGKYGD